MEEIIALFDYRMENYFRNCKLNVFIRKHPNYRELMNHYKKRIEEVQQEALENNPGLTMFKNPREIYSREFVFGDGDYAWIHWDVKQLEYWSTMADKRTLSVNALAGTVDLKTIDKKRLNYALRNDKPIYVLEHEPNDEFFCADGNHRIMARYLVGQEKEYEDVPIEGYVFDVDLHMMAMKTEVDRTIYKVLCNIAMIYKYYKNNGPSELSLEEFEDEYLYEI